MLKVFEEDGDRVVRDVAHHNRVVMREGCRQWLENLPECAAKQIQHSCHFRIDRRYLSEEAVEVAPSLGMRETCFPFVEFEVEQTQTQTVFIDGYRDSDGQCISTLRRFVRAHPFTPQFVSLRRPLPVADLTAYLVLAECALPRDWHTCQPADDPETFDWQATGQLVVTGQIPWLLNLQAEMKERAGHVKDDVVWCESQLGEQEYSLSGDVVSGDFGESPIQVLGRRVLARFEKLTLFCARKGLPTRLNLDFRWQPEPGWQALPIAA